MEVIFAPHDGSIVDMSTSEEENFKVMDKVEVSENAEEPNVPTIVKAEKENKNKPVV